MLTIEVSPNMKVHTVTAVTGVSVTSGTRKIAAFLALFRRLHMALAERKNFRLHEDCPKD